MLVLTDSVSCSCLQAKHYNAAASVLEQTIYDVEPAKTSMKPIDLLLYCYYGGMIHIGTIMNALQLLVSLIPLFCELQAGACESAGRRRYPEALHMFLQGLTAPTFVVNAITIATYKKYALVSLIHSGKSVVTCCLSCHAGSTLLPMIEALYVAGRPA